MIRKGLLKGLGIVLLLCCAAVAFAAPPKTINYQGYLTDNAGGPVTAPAKTMGFALYSTTSGKTPLWNETQNVKVNKGIYNVLLGSTAPIRLPFDTQYYLGITVPSDLEMTPRQALTNTPYAFRAGCSPGDMLNCYTGPAGTLNVGVCISGIRTCKEDGSSFGPCTGEVIPSQEVCYNLFDEDCDGKIDNGCTPHFCEPGTTAACYYGPPGTQGVGNCHAGTTACNEEGSAYGSCEGAVYPSQEVCDSQDNDCDGATDNNLNYSSVANGSFACISGATVLLCNTGYGNCVTSGACDTYTANNAQHCGVCGNVCAAGTVCSSSVCSVSCQSGQTNCSGTCVNLQSDRSHCGSCTAVCPAGEVCSGGACVVSCQSPLVNCSDQCVDTRYDPTNCGACGTVCLAGHSCLNSSCQ
jgi:hypothetical protein